MAKIHDESDDLADLAGVDIGPLAVQIGFALRRAQVTVFQDFHRRFAEDDIRPAQYSVLKVLKHNPGLRQTQVSAALGVKRTNFVPLFDTLEKRGLAERRKVDGDRRAFALFLTEAGLRMLASLDEKVAAHEAKFVGRLGAGQQFQLLAMLGRMCDPAFDPPG